MITSKNYYYKKSIIADNPILIIQTYIPRSSAKIALSIPSRLSHAPLLNDLLYSLMVARFEYKWNENGWIEKEIGQGRPGANKTEMGISFIIQLSFQPDPCTPILLLLIMDLKVPSLRAY